MRVPRGTAVPSPATRRPAWLRRSVLLLSVSAIVLAAAIMALATLSSSALAYSDGYIDTDILNLRDEPGTWGTILDQMWQGEYVVVLDGPTDDGWYQVEYNGTVGWAFGYYLSVDGEVGWSDAGGYAGSTAWVATNRLNVRSSASTSSLVLDVLSTNDEVWVSGGKVDGFVPVSVNGLSGWVWSGYLSWSGPSYDSSEESSSGERWIDVDRSNEMVTLYDGDDAIGSYWGAMGYDDSSDGFYSTAVGTYYVYEKWDGLSWTDWGQVYITYWVGFDPSRSNGFHSYSLDAYGNVLPNGDGATGGCVALAPWAAEIVYDFADYGTRVEVHW
jgi:uncharacterized protein YgiM (DUF1202 family)